MDFRSLFLALCLLAPRPAFGVQPQCKPIGVIYKDGRELCERMWGKAFRYETDEAKGFTMWFDQQDGQPNDEATLQMGKTIPQRCHLQYYHKATPDQEQRFLRASKVCSPWRRRACCAQDNFTTTNSLKEAYGKHYHWDRCGALSAACEHFFVAEACFYECDPSLSNFKKYHDDIYDARCDPSSTSYQPEFAQAMGCEHNNWEVHQAPIKASFCNAWWEACQDDLWCAEGDGSYHKCAKLYKKHDQEEL